MKDKRVGVFMQLYRNEPSMHKAIQSVLDQTYKNFRYYILVGDKTKDEVGKYAARDERIEIIDGKPGQGFRTHIKMVASDENEYVTVLDADDWYEKEYLEELILYAEKYHTDITACDYFFCNENGQIVGRRGQIRMAWDVQETGRVLGYMYGFFRAVWGKLIAAECVLKWEPEKLPTYEQYGGYGGDTMMMFDLLTKASRAGICEKTLYNYRISPTSASYELKQGRLESDELVFRFVEKVLLGFGEMGEAQRRYLMLVYGNALIDTTTLLLNAKLTEGERAEKLAYIYRNELSKELLNRERMNALDTSFIKEGEFRARFYELLFRNVVKCAVTEQTTRVYLELFEILYPRWKGILVPEEFSVILKRKEMLDCLTQDNYRRLFCLVLDVLPDVKLTEAKTCLGLLRRLTKEPLLNSMLQEKKFVVMYRELIELLNIGEREKSLEKLHQYFSTEKILYGDDILVELWINLAASLEAAGEFVIGKQLKAELLLQKGKQEEGRKEYEDLLQMGIQDENMEYLKGLLKV